MAFFFAYSAVRTAAQNLGFTCAIYFSINIYYGCLCKSNLTPRKVKSIQLTYAIQMHIPQKSFPRRTVPRATVSPSAATALWV